MTKPVEFFDLVGDLVSKARKGEITSFAILWNGGPNVEVKHQRSMDTREITRRVATDIDHLSNAG